MKQNTTSETDRNNNIGTLHLIAAVLVIFGHHYAISGLPAAFLLGSPFHVIGVRIIFLISGYLITKSAWTLKGYPLRRLPIYLLKRFGRIYPELIGCLLITTFVIGPLFTDFTVIDYFAEWKMLWHYILSNLRLYIAYTLPGMFFNNPYPYAVNGSLWTMPIEAALYLLVFLISMFQKNRRKIYTGITFLVVMFSLLRFAFFPYASKIVYGTDLFQALNIVPFFLIGGMAYLYHIQKYLNLQLAAILLFAMGSISFSSMVVTESICIILLSYFIVSLMLAPEQRLKVKWLRSEYAYGMYLWGFVSQQCIMQKFSVKSPHPLVFWGTFLLSILCTYFMAALSHHIIYMPINKLNKNMIVWLSTRTGKVC